MPGQVTFKIDAESASAVNAFLKVVEAQKKSETGFKQQTHAANEHGGTLDKLGHHAKEAAHEILAMGTAFLSLEGVKELIEGIMEALEKARREIAEFHHDAAGAASMPQYIKDLPGYKARTLKLSEEYGFDVKDVNALREQIAIGESTKPVEFQRQMEESALRTAELTGGQPADVARVEEALTKTYEGMSVKQAENAVLFFREKGMMRAQEQAEIIPTVLPAMKMLNVPRSDVEALMAMLPHAGGVNSQLARGIRESLVKFDDLQEQGVITKGAGLFKNFQELAELQRTDAATFDKLLGKRAAPAVSFVVQHPELFQELKKQAIQYDRGAGLGTIEHQLEADPETRRAMETRREEQKEKNLSLRTSESEQKAMGHFAEWKMREKENLPVSFQNAWWVPPVLSPALDAVLNQIRNGGLPAGFLPGEDWRKNVFGPKPEQSGGGGEEEESAGEAHRDAAEATHKAAQEMHEAAGDMKQSAQLIKDALGGPQPVGNTHREWGGAGGSW